MSNKNESNILDGVKEVGSSGRRRFLSAGAIISAAIPVGVATYSTGLEASTGTSNIHFFKALSDALNSHQLSEGDTVFIHQATASIISRSSSTYYRVVYSNYTSPKSVELHPCNVNSELALLLMHGDCINLNQVANPTNINNVSNLLITGDSITTGGVIDIPIGKNNVSSRAYFRVDGHNNFVNRTILGSGKAASALDFSKANGADSGVVFEPGVFYSLRDLAVYNSKSDGVAQLGGEFTLDQTTGIAWNHAYFADLRVSYNEGDGVSSGRGFLGTYSRVFASHNAGHGFNMQGLHTSLRFDNCYSARNEVGYKINQAFYSSIGSCASDLNSQHGYEISNSHSLDIAGSGAEHNRKSGFYLTASSTSGENKNISLNSVFGFNNNSANQGFANLLHLKSEGGKENTATLINSASKQSNSAHLIEDVIVDGEGAYLVEGFNDLPNGVRSQRGGYIQHLPKHTVVPNKSVTSPTAICRLLSPQGHSSAYGGELMIQASNGDPASSLNKNTALYKIAVCKSDNTVFVEQQYALGRIEGAGRSWPSFSWSVENDQLIATPINAANGQFYFEVLGTGFVKTTK
ncbi:hypothetical protein N474_22840 [Pseudoalteromonas luteoviolacea CPMOR-2]|uniref:Right handed beta helix domain-containing protein n=1 Tax=Pseudoalteromonas luteoviolacea DSM 6061 TaxID=1365250 RepID=A0A166YQC2_9GAMM|nr:hypothetical protein [Pseudoalteromonas luteoviolacea]KZN43260.1 hypothetical protein N475_09155 [Pseudoalteromonas luteoviolacea DSM 6061]KZN52675.1 hypothetical protein N474_22840 [Pseudoalteromonas luteoviolacea CPMOR-2]MBE0385473.1 hypothetical protein [Pseudoalteromonas luteoviolacea DSM 6061]